MQAIGPLAPERKLAEDASGEYWLARDSDLDRYCLVRLHVDVLAADAPPIEFQRLSFMRQARALAALDHRNIARLLDYGRLEDDTPYLVLPPYPRRLTERLADAAAPVGLPEGLGLIAEMAAGLSVVHAAGMSHGALAPDAVFLAETAPRVKLMGFRTMEARLAGEPPPNPSDDVFRLGLLAFRLTTGGQPGPKAPRPRDVQPALSADLDAWIVRCLARNPAARPADGIAAWAALQEAMQA